MTRRTAFQPDPSQRRLYRRQEGDRSELATLAVGAPPPVYGERWLPSRAGLLRAWDPVRSKLAAAILRGWDGALPAVGERWLYLGVASGTTGSHVADLVGPEGRVYGVDKSVRPFARFLEVAERYPNLLPVFGDARRPRDYVGSVPIVDGLYVDVAQPDQVEIVEENVRLYLRTSGKVLVALKTSSMGRDRGAKEHLDRAMERLTHRFDMDRPVGLDPFHRRHYLIGGNPTRRAFEESTGRPTPPPGRHAARRP
jgi:fibrillarin-like pre-rRNA processing protein